MESYRKPYEYKDEIVKRYKEYNLIVHTKQEKDYNWLSDENCYSIEIKNSHKDSESLFIDLEDEITISHGNWHCHYYYEDRDDFEEAMDKVDNILKSKDCHLTIFSNGKSFASGSSLNKEKYSKEDALKFVKTFFDGETLKEFTKTFKQYGVIIKFEFWDKSKNYEINLPGELF